MVSSAVRSNPIIPMGRQEDLQELVLFMDAPIPSLRELSDF